MRNRRVCLKTAPADKLKADKAKREKDKAIAREVAAKVAQLEKEQKELARFNLTAQKKEEKWKQALESKAAKAKKY